MRFAINMSTPTPTSRLIELVDKRSITGDHFYTNFDGLRALAALMVLVMHVYTVPFLATGAPGVFLFFGLSGFLLYSGFLSIKQLDSVALVAYLIRRIFRILPLFGFFVLSFAYLFNDWSADQSFTWSMNHLLFLYGQIHLWTIRAEMQFYMVLPLVAVLLVFIPSELYRFILLVTIAAVAMWMFADYFAMFFLGMAAVHARKWISQRVGLYLAYISLFSILILSSYVDLTEPLRNLLGIRHRHLMYQYGLVFFPLCFFLLVGVSRFKSRLFSNRWLRLIGICGYGIYLWHVPVMLWLREMDLNFWQFQISFYVITIGWSILTYRLIELPGIQIGRMIARWVRSDQAKGILRPLYTCLFLLALMLGFRSGFVDPKIMVEIDIWSPVQGTSYMSVIRDENEDWVDGKPFPLRNEQWQTLAFSWWDQPIKGLRVYLPQNTGEYRIKEWRIKFPFAENRSLALARLENVHGTSTRTQDGELIIVAANSAPVFQIIEEQLQPSLNARNRAVLVFGIAMTLLLLSAWYLDSLLRWWYVRAESKELSFVHSP
jgi:peptidoglycan/LPS O-acetylase OafA/YrhL